MFVYQEGSFGLLAYKQRCTNCKAKEHCEQIGSPLPKTSLDGCEKQCLKTVGCKMSEYTEGILPPCSLYNCELVDKRSGSTVIRNARNSGKLINKWCASKHEKLDRELCPEQPPVFKLGGWI